MYIVSLTTSIIYDVKCRVAPKMLLINFKKILLHPRSTAFGMVTRSVKIK